MFTELEYWMTPTRVFSLPISKKSTMSLTNVLDVIKSVAPTLPEPSSTKTKSMPLLEHPGEKSETKI